jgi:glutathione S-transferase
MIRLYGTRQSRATRCLWALEELGVPYELVVTNLATDAKTPAYREINPNARVPALVDGELKLFESLAINLYLAKTYDKSGLYPRSPADEARAIQWSIWVMTEAEPGLLAILMNRMILPPAERSESAAQAAQEKLAQPFAVLDGVLADRKYLLGDAFTIADLNVAAVLSWAVLCKLDLSKTPHTRRWLEECLARPGFTKARKG